MSWPPDYYAEFKTRIKRKNVIFDKPELIPSIQAVYADDPLLWINDWAVTMNPRNEWPTPKILPFILFPRQVEFVQFILGCLTDKENGLVEKSRDMGATWLCCAISVWMFLYKPSSVIGWGSLKAEQVDKHGDPKAIFPKIRQTIEFLPQWMLPDGFRMHLHANYMRVVNPRTGAAIIGESGDNMGRGGRTSIYFKDESAHYEHAESVEAALGDNTDVQIDVSSVNGSANVFYRRRMAGQIWMPGEEMEKGRTRVFIMDWRENPLKNQAWYDMRRKKAEAEGLLHIFAQEVDRDYTGSVERIIIKGEWIRAAVDAHIKLKFEPEGMKVAGQDVADGGGDKNALAVVHGNVLRFVDHWGGEAPDAAKIAIPICVELGVDELYYDSIGVGSGFKGGVNSIRERGGIPPRLRVKPWNGGGEVLDPDSPIIPGDMQSPTNKDQYHNLKAQGWFRLRARFYKTYRAVVHGEKFFTSELISLDSSITQLHQLQMELTQAIHKYSQTGKTMVDKKPDGALSPNLADAVVIAYTPAREVSILDVL